MNTTVSTKYQVVIPKAIRRKLGILPGQKLNISIGNHGNILLRKDNSLNNAAFIEEYGGIIKRNKSAWKEAGLDPNDWLRKLRDTDWK